MGNILPTLMHWQVSELVTVRQDRCLARSWQAWQVYLSTRCLRLRSRQLAARHHLRRLGRCCLRAWQRETEHGVMQMHQVQAMRTYRGAVGAALRWYAMSRALQRQRVIVDRAVRMYGHRVIAGTQRAVLQAWAIFVERERVRRSSAAAAFCQAFVIMTRAARLAWAFRTWASACATSTKAMAASLAAELKQVGATYYLSLLH